MFEHHLLTVLIKILYHENTHYPREVGYRQMLKEENAAYAAQPQTRRYDLVNVYGDIRNYEEIFCVLVQNITVMAML
jgi:hypothetical protein